MGRGSNLFHQGAAKQSDDPDVIAATLAKPGVVLKRPVGSKAPFSEHPGLPTELGRGDKRSGGTRKAPARTPRRALAGPSIPRRSERPRLRTNAMRSDASGTAPRRRLPRRGSASAGERPSTRLWLRPTRARAGTPIEAEREAIDKKLEAENARWDKERARLQVAVKRARG